jgi:hypothetical protein
MDGVTENVAGVGVDCKRGEGDGAAMWTGGGTFGACEFVLAGGHDA